MVFKQNGIALVGSCLVDELLPPVKPGQLIYVDAARFVDETELHSEKLEYSVGGMALNVSVDLAKINGGYPVAVFGQVGNDEQSKVIFEILEANGVIADKIIVAVNQPTSSTEVIYLNMPDGSIERIFRHRIGAMGTFNKENIDLSALREYKIAMFGYGLLLPQLDLEDNNYGTVLGNILAETQKLNIRTAMDFVSPDEQNKFKFLRYQKSLKYVDICCINDDQAHMLTGARNPKTACIELVEKYGAQIGVVHCGAEGPNYAYSKETGLLIRQNYLVFPDDIKGNAGAGDAFSAGILHGIHQEWPLQKSLKFAAACAAVSLSDVSCTGGVRSEKEIMNYMENTQTKPQDSK